MLKTIGAPMLLALVAASTADALSLSRGLYFDPDRVGHGFDLEQVGERWVLVFYTYDAEGRPEWYLSVAEDDGAQVSGPLDRFRYDTAAEPPQQLERSAGEFSLAREVAGCDQVAFRWTLDGESGQWCVQPLLADDNRPERDFGGLWFAGAEDQGWGLTLDFTGGEDPVSVGVLFYFDADGQPRWTLGTGDGTGGGSIEMDSFSGYCRGCPSQPTEATPAGRIDFEVMVERGRAAGTANLDVFFPEAPGGAWQRSAATIVPLSDPQPGLIEIPDRIATTTAIAITGADIIPMTDDAATLVNHDLLVENGVIAGLAPGGTLPIPADAHLIDGRGLFLVPGLSEMHLHVSFGGPQAAREAGLLMLANGVTTAFNVGDGFQMDIPGLADEYLREPDLGPTLYTANVAYGPGDQSDAPRTVATAADASAYAQRLFDAGYDVLKVYWQVPILALRQYFEDAERLGMPVIGHIPLRQPMETSLASGQVMAVHVQEPYVSFMNARIAPDLIDPAADIFLANGTYLTPTLAVFESYSAIFGGDTEAYQALIAREGAQYTNRAVRNGWRSYFFSGGIQGNGQVIGALDRQYAFFEDIVDRFDERGIPLLIGTDAPGFPGVMSGFGAIQEMRLFVAAGVSPAATVAAATRNAGAFIDATLGPAVSFGTIEVGKRADLVLLEADPRSDIENVTRRVGVMARGDWFSAAHLQARLETLAATTAKSVVEDDAPFDLLPDCADHIGAWSGRPAK